MERGVDILAVEAKSGSTVASDAWGPLARVAELLPEVKEQLVIHGGSEAWSLHGGRAVPYRELDSVDWIGGVRAKRRR